MIRVRGRCSFCMTAQSGLYAVPRKDKDGEKALMCRECVRRMAGVVADDEAAAAQEAAQVIKHAPDKRPAGRPKVKK